MSLHPISKNRTARATFGLGAQATRTAIQHSDPKRPDPTSISIPGGEETVMFVNSAHYNTANVQYTLQNEFMPRFAMEKRSAVCDHGGRVLDAQVSELGRHREGLF